MYRYIASEPDGNRFDITVNGYRGNDSSNPKPKLKERGMKELSSLTSIIFNSTNTNAIRSKKVTAKGNE